MAVIHAVFSFNDRTRNGFDIAIEAFFPKSVVKCEQFAAFPPFPQTKIEAPDPWAVFNKSTTRATASTGTDSTARFCASKYSPIQETNDVIP
jgi:hypothetical protein